MDEQVIKKFIDDSQRKEQERIADEIVETQIKIFSALYEKASAYTQLIIVAGYASYFGIWALVKEYINSRSAIWSALLMSLSVTIFVFFEVAKMTLTGWFLLRRNSTIQKISEIPNPQKILEVLRTHDSETQKYSVKWCKFWVYTLLPTVLFALVAIVILLIALIQELVCGL